MSATSAAIWLSYNNEEEIFQLPVNPPSIEVSRGGSSKSYSVLGLGEVNVIKEPELKQISIESFFPAVTDTHLVVSSELLRPMEYVQKILKWMDKMRPIRFVYNAYNPIRQDIREYNEINLAMSIEDFTWKEVAGTPGDIQYKLSLKEYVFYSAKKLYVDESSQQLEAEEPPRPVEREQPKTYALKPGEGLWRVAQKCLGDGSRYKEIQQLNGIAGHQLNKLPIGMVLKLP
ncbi:LysM peptidoglycan-binding domain-containing protein [Paenibacillus senegalensis]|uniref:LysM peptidoglycan-binding domain-containing protein n=1 Tax=Paenibacillus senegalensis TaxID=1465766 RepID=UPI00028881B0|nr:LysM peptidoglycan-binding domain-containing protein [Paenibacillus senegalensis]